MKNFFLMWADTLKDMEKAARFRHQLTRILGRVLFLAPALVFAVRMMRFNRRIRVLGLRSAAARLLRNFYGGIEVHGKVPQAKRGGLLVCNHPGIGDSLALLESLEESTFWLVAMDRLFFRAMPEVFRRLILVDPDPRKRVGAVLKMAEALRRGEFVILYPAGSIEPDPKRPNGQDLLKPWSPVIGLLVRQAKREGWSFPIHPLLTSGILSQEAMDNFWVNRFSDRQEREAAAVSWVLVSGVMRKSRIRLDFGEPVGSADLAGLPSLEAITESVRAKAAALDPWS